jgi:hypothetical protein
VANKFTSPIMNLTQRLPTYARRNKRVDTSNFQEIEESESDRVIDWIELAIPDCR